MSKNFSYTVLGMFKFLIGRLKQKEIIEGIYGYESLNSSLAD